MTLLVGEFSQVIHRILCVAPDEGSLRRLFVDFGEEITAYFGVEGNQLDLVAQKIPGSTALQFWLSFNLGKRGTLDDRVTLLGLSLDKPRPSRDFWDIADALVFWCPEKEPSTWDAFFRLPVEEMDSRQKPCIVGGVSAQAPGELSKLALEEFFKRNFDKIRFEGESETFLSSSLKWALSF